MVTTSCPSEEHLWPAVMGEPLESVIEQHLMRCTVCRERITVERERLSWLRSSTSIPALSLPTPLECPSLSDLLIWASGDERAAPVFLDEPEEKQDLVSLLAGCSKLGKYRIVRELSSGGQGTVLHAWHTTLNREVAIKVCHQAVDANRQSRIVSEGALLARINHPGLAQVYDLDVHEGRPYLVMEYVAGHNLRQVMQMSTPTLKARTQIMNELAAAVAEAHRHGILHLDLKPENVMLDEQNHVKLIDFGMSWLMPDAEPKDRLVAGTFEYMAPEQMRGQTSRWSSRTDVYGLGAVLYFLLTGSPPVDTRRLRTVGEHDQTIRAAINILKCTPGFRGLQHTCARALDPDPARRFRDAHELVRALGKTQQLPWLAAVLIAVGLCGMAAPFLPLDILEPDTRQGAPGLMSVSEATLRPGVRMSVLARCSSETDLSLFLWLPQHGIVPFKGLATTHEAGTKAYRLPASQDVMSLHDMEWAIVLAVETSDDSEPHRELVKLSKLASNAKLPESVRVDFASGRWQDKVPAHLGHDFLSQFLDQCENAKINCQGVYIRSSGLASEQKPIVSSVQLLFP